VRAALWLITDKTGLKSIIRRFLSIICCLIRPYKTAQKRLVGLPLIRRCHWRRGQAGSIPKTNMIWTALKSSGVKSLKLGRSCLHPSYRRRHRLLHQLWPGLASYCGAASESRSCSALASFTGPKQMLLARAFCRCCTTPILRPRKLWRVTACLKRRSEDGPGFPADTADRRQAMYKLPRPDQKLPAVGGWWARGPLLDP